MSLTFKISSAILGIVFFSVSLLVFLTYFKYESTLSTLVRSRFSVIANDIQSTISNGLSLGVTLTELRTTQEVLEQAKSGDDQILSIKVFELIDENSGKILYNTRLAGVGGSVPESWIRTMLSSKPSQPWYLSNQEGNIVGTTLINNFGTPVGGIVVRYSEKYSQIKAEQVLQELIQKTAIVIAISCLVVVLGSFAFIRPISKSFKNINKFLMTNEVFEKADWGAYQPKNDIEDLFVSAGKKSTKLMEDLKAVKEEMSIKGSGNGENE